MPACGRPYRKLRSACMPNPADSGWQLAGSALFSLASIRISANGYLLTARACGQLVGSMWDSPGSNPGLFHTTETTAQARCVLTTVSAQFIQAFQQPLPTSIFRYLALLLAVVSPLSTLPINTTTKYINYLLLGWHILSEKLRLLTPPYRFVRLRSGARLSSQTALTPALSKK